MPIKFEKKNHVAYITINNPEKANIMDRETNNELDAAWREIWEDLDVRATILTGAGDKYFCAGHNIQVNPDVTDEEREFLRAEVCSGRSPVQVTANVWVFMDKWEITSQESTNPLLQL